MLPSDVNAVVHWLTPINLIFLWGRLETRRCCFRVQRCTGQDEVFAGRDAHEIVRHRLRNEIKIFWITSAQSMRLHAATVRIGKSIFLQRMEFAWIVFQPGNIFSLYHNDFALLAGRPREDSEPHRRHRRQETGRFIFSQPQDTQHSYSSCTLNDKEMSVHSARTPLEDVPGFVLAVGGVGVDI